MRLWRLYCPTSTCYLFHSDHWMPGHWWEWSQDFPGTELSPWLMKTEPDELQYHKCYKPEKNTWDSSPSVGISNICSLSWFSDRKGTPDRWKNNNLAKYSVMRNIIHSALSYQTLLDGVGNPSRTPAMDPHQLAAASIPVVHINEASLTNRKNMNS